MEFRVHTSVREKGILQAEIMFLILLRLLDPSLEQNLYVKIQMFIMLSPNDRGQRGRYSAHSIAFSGLPEPRPSCPIIFRDLHKNR